MTILAPNDSEWRKMTQNGVKPVQPAQDSSEPLRTAQNDAEPLRTALNGADLRNANGSQIVALISQLKISSI